MTGPPPSRARRAATLAVAVLVVAAGLPLGAVAVPTHAPPVAGADGPAVAAGAASVTGSSGTVNVSLAPSGATVEAGNRTTFDLVVSGFTDGVRAVDVDVNTTDASVAPVTGATTTLGATFSETTLADDGSGVRVRIVGADTASTGTLTVARVTVEGDTAGTAGIEIGSAIVGDDGDRSYPIDERRNATLTVDPRPGSLALSANRSTVAPGEPVRFEATGSPAGGRPTRYEWDVDDDGTYERTTSAGAIEYAYGSLPGIAWSPSVRVTDDTGATATAGTSLRSGNDPPVAAAGVNRTIVSAGGSTGVAFDASGSSDPDGSVASYEWDFGADGTVDATGVRAVGSFPPGNQRRGVPVVLTVTDGQGATDTVRLLVTVAAAANQPPTAAFSQSPVLPLPRENVTLNATAASDPDGSIVGYDWDVDGDGSAETSGREVTLNVSDVTANATLTVTDDDGATATASKQVATGFLRPDRTGTFDVGGTTTYLNSPPIANFSVSPARPEPADTIRFRSGSYDLDGGIDDLTWYVNGTEGQFLESAFGTVDDTLTLAAYEGSLSAGTYNVTLVVTDHVGATSRTTRNVTVRDREDDPDVTLQFRGTGRAPGKILVGEPVEFRADARAVAGRSIRSLEWSFLGAADTTLSGRSVVTSFTSAGTAAMTLEVEDSAGESAVITKTIEVEPRDEVPKITDVTPEKEGATLRGVSLTNTYTATIEANDAIERVEFELAGRTQTDRSGGDGWSGQFDLERLNDDATLTVTAVDEDGDRDTTTRRVEVVRTPDWIAGMIDEGSVTVRQNSPTEIVVTRRIPDPPIDVEFDPSVVDIPVIKRWAKAQFTVRSELRLIYGMETQTARIDGDGAFVAALGPYESSNEIVAKGRLGVDSNEQWYLQNLRVTAQIGKCCWTERVSASASHSFGGVPVTVKGRAAATLSLGRDVAVTVQLGQRNGNLALTGGQIAVALRASGSSATLSGKACYTGPASFCLGAGASAYFEKAALAGAIQFETAPFRLRPALRFDSKLQLSANVAGFSPSTTLTFGGKIGSAPIRTLALSRPSTGEPLAVPTGPDDRSGGATTLDVAPRPPVATAGITDDGTRDGPPALAAGNDTYTAVWARQDPDGPSGETDVYAATSDDGTAWSAPEPIADGRHVASTPDVAAGGDRRAAVWTRVPLPTNDTTAADVRTNSSLALAVDDGSGWTTPVTVEDGNESRPVVADAGEQFLLAWVRDRDGNLTTTADRQVRWTTYDGSLGRIRTIRNATAVDVAAGTDGAVLAYLASDDGANGSVVRAELTGGTLVETARHAATGVREVAAGPRGVAWTSLGANGVVLRHAPVGGDATTVPTDGVLNVGDPTLLGDAGRPVLVYLGTRLAPNASRAAFVQRRGDDGWLSARPLTPTTGAVDRRMGPSGAAVGEDELVAAVAARNRTAGRPADVVATRLGLAPDLAVSARTDADLDDASVGDRVRVNYTVRNVGDRSAAERVAVTAETAAGTVATRTHGPLAVGDRANGSVVVRVDESGRLTVRADAGDAVAESDETNNAARLVTARPDLRASAADVTRERRGDDLLVAADVGNRGPVPVANATVRLRSGNDTVAEERVDVPGNGTRTVRLRVPMAAINRTAGDALVVDPADGVAESDETNNAAGLRLLAVDLGLSDAVDTAGAPGGTLADAFVTSAGPVDATAAVTVAANGTALTYDVPVDAPERAGGRTVRRVRLYHPTGDGTLDLDAAPRTGRDADGFDNAVRTAVDATGNDTAPVRVIGVNATVTDGTATVAVDLSNAGPVTAGVPLRMSADGATVAERTAVVAGGANRTVTLNAPVATATDLTVTAPGSSATGSVEPAAPDVNGDGRAATDTDGDGRYEDVTGDGTVNVVDVAVLLARFDDTTVQRNVALFDFDGDGTVNVVDVAVLLEET